MPSNNTLNPNSLRKKAGLTLVGVGPGDPLLLTIAAVQAIHNATVIAYPVAEEGKDSMAYEIASHWIDNRTKRLPILFPMVCEENLLKEAWKKAGDQLATAVANGENVVFLCQGDISLFASGSYVLLQFKANYPSLKLDLIPGINSFSAAAAAGAWPLTMQNDQLLVMSTPDRLEDLKQILEDTPHEGRVLALLKLGSRWKWVRPLLEQMDLLDDSLFVQRVGFADQEVFFASEVSAVSKAYFSLLLVRQGWPAVLP